VFNAALRSVLAAGLLMVWMRARGLPGRIDPGSAPWGLLIGTLFAVEFLCLFSALDLTTVARTSVIFYTMPVWLAVMAHFLAPGDRLSTRKVLGLMLALAGTAWAILDRAEGGEASLAGDLLALGGAWCWAAIALFTKISPFSRVSPQMQLMWQVLISAPILLIAATFFGPSVRDFVPLHLLGVLFQAAVVAGGFLVWFWLLKIYPASGVASFAFLSPVVGVVCGWLILGERVGGSLWGSLALVAVGLTLINRPARSAGPARGGR